MTQAVVQDSTAGLRKWTKRILILLAASPFIFVGLIWAVHALVTMNWESDDFQRVKDDAAFQRNLAIVPQAMQFTLADGMSARYAGQYMGHTWDGHRDPQVVCGVVNAKNRFGAYTGFRKFFISLGSGNVVIEPADMVKGSLDETDFKISWKTFC